ncbi:MAG: hypothetical protein ACF8LL_03770, partial [Phycisphaerales bacterium]
MKIERLLRLALLAFPRDFREAHGDDMVAALRDGWQRHRSLLRLARESVGLITQVLGERRATMRGFS